MGDEVERLLRHVTECKVGDITVARSRHGHGWIVSRRNDQEFMLTTGEWRSDDDVHPRNAMLCFAHLVQALTTAERDFTDRTGLIP